MKKILALVLAVMMLSTMALAQQAQTPVVGDDTSNELAITYYDTGLTAPGSKIYLYVGNTGFTGVSGGSNLTVPVTSKYFSVAKLKYTEGKDLVESIAFDDANEQLVITLKQDFTKLVKDTGVAADDINLDFGFTLKGKGKYNNVTVADVAVTVKATVGYNYGEITIDADGETDLTTIAADTLYEVVRGTNGKYIGELDIDIGDVNLFGRVYEGEKLFLETSEAVPAALAKKYAEKEAELSYLSFVGAPTFNSVMTLTAYMAEDTFMYEMVDGKIAKEIKWSDDDSAFILKTNTLGTYLFSDVALELDSAASTDNPDTGANDMVGIATALAAVALVSAAAVSLKK